MRRWFKRETQQIVIVQQSDESELILQPCPFCGGDAKVRTKTHLDDYGTIIQYHAVECQRCGASNHKSTQSQFRRSSEKFVVFHDGYTEAVQLWNKRVANGGREGDV